MRCTRLQCVRRYRAETVATFVQEIERARERKLSFYPSTRCRLVNMCSPLFLLARSFHTTIFSVRFTILDKFFDFRSIHSNVDFFFSSNHVSSIVITGQEVAIMQQQYTDRENSSTDQHGISLYFYDCHHSEVTNSQFSNRDATRITIIYLYRKWLYMYTRYSFDPFFVITAISIRSIDHSTWLWCEMVQSVMLEDIYIWLHSIYGYWFY